MITVNQLIDYGNTLQQAIECINYNRVIIDESQLIKNIREISTEQNNLLYLVIPSASSAAKSEDSVFENTQMLFMILKKQDRSQSHDEFLKAINDTQLCMQKVKHQMIEDKQSCNGFMRLLDLSSFDIDPVWSVAGCDGWQIQFSMESKF